MNGLNAFCKKKKKKFVYIILIFYLKRNKNIFALKKKGDLRKFFLDETIQMVFK